MTASLSPRIEVDCWTSVASPWAWLGSARFGELAQRFDLNVKVRPVHLGKVFDATGGQPFGRRSVARQTYRQLELQRWSVRLGVPIQLEPLFYPVNREPASRLILALRESGTDPDGHRALQLLHHILKAIWVEDRNIADWPTLGDLARHLGLDAEHLLAAAQAPSMAQMFADETRQAVAAGVFGAPTWILAGERFWGQDRLDFLAERLGSRPTEPA